MAQLLVEAGANIDLELSRGFSPIIIAISLAHNEMVQYLIEQKANIQVTSKYRTGPLTEAVIRGDLGILALLLSAVDDADEMACSRITAIFQAVSCNKPAILEMTLRSDKLDPNRVCVRTLARTALVRACERGKLKCVELLCNDKRTNINFFDVTSASPIQTAIDGAHWDVALCLIRSGRLQQGRWGRYFKSLCRDGRVGALGVAEELIRRANMTKSIASRWKMAALQYRRPQLQKMIGAKLAEWKWRQ